MPKLVTQTTAKPMMKAAAAAYTGAQRAASQSSSGNSIAAGSTVAHRPGGRDRMTALTAAKATRETAPSISSRRGRTSRTIWATPISTGAIVTMPSPSEANHTRQMLKMGAVVWNSRIVIAPPMAAVAAPMVAASRKPSSVEAVEPERGTEPPGDKPRREHGLARVAKPLEYRGPEAPVTQEIGGNGCDRDADRHRHPRARSQRNQDAGGDA